MLSDTERHLVATANDLVDEISALRAALQQLLEAAQSVADDLFCNFCLSECRTNLRAAIEAAKRALS
ncbi:MAG: hypothetical protein H5U04_12385 [Firmicutes bacterium]|nr:hypothetical protein [Bacillota bacterium]